MEWMIEKRIDLEFTWIELKAVKIGEDISVWVYGGERPHIGCTVLAIPRPSLSGDGSGSVTSSVLNVTGHKDEALCRRIAEAFCKKYGVTTVCSGGFHMERITMGQIVEVIQAVEEMM